MKYFHISDQNRARLRWTVGFLLIGNLLLLNTAYAQQEAPPENQAETAGPPPGQGGPPPIPVLLGVADFLIAIDRPFDAANIYNGILAQDPQNGAAQQGLQNAQTAQKTTWTALAHYYGDSHDVELFTYGGGPTFRTRYGNLTLTAGTGTFKNDTDITNDRNPWTDVATDKWRGDIALDDDAFQKSTINLQFEPHYHQFEGFLFLSQVLYDEAPDRFLFDFRASYVPEPGRERYTAILGRHDTFLQNQRAEFFAPESFFAVITGLTMYHMGVAIEYPLLPSVDFLPAYSHYEYSDGNRRDILRASVFYRLRPGAAAPMPVFRVGLNYVYDHMEDFAPYYYAPQNVNGLSLTAEYVMMSRNLKYGLFGSYPVIEENGSGFATHEMPWTLFGFVNYALSNSIELYAKGGGIDSTGFDLTFIDIVVGTNIRF